jgi:hypothetical protein
VRRGWGEMVDRRLDIAVAEVMEARPGQLVQVRAVLDDRGVVAVVVTAGDGRLVTAARSVDLVPVGWPWPDGVAKAFGVWPVHEVPTVAELLAGLVVAV